MKSCIIICTKNREEDVSKAMDSISKQTRLPDELMIVDAGDDNSLNSRLQAVVPDPIKFVYVQSNPGLTIQRNVGIHHTSADIVMFIDDDCILQPDYIKTILDVFESDSECKIGAALGNITNLVPPAGQSRYPLLAKAGRFWSMSMNRLFLGTELGDGSMKLSGLPACPCQSTNAKFISCLAGGAMSFRRELFKQISFDELMSGYCYMEDVDIARQVSKTGYKMFYAPEAKLTHHPSEHARNSSPIIAKMRLRNHYYLYRKHTDGSVVQFLAFSWSVCGILLWYLSKGTFAEFKAALSAVNEMLQHTNPLVQELHEKSKQVS